MLFRSNEVNYYNSLVFGSSDDPNSNIHPKLRACYTPANSIAEDELNTIKIYPNPFSGMITVSDVSHAIQAVKLFNVLGEQVLFSEVKNHCTVISLNISALSTGIYFAHVITDHGVFVRKLVKN